MKLLSVLLVSSAFVGASALAAEANQPEAGSCLLEATGNQGTLSCVSPAGEAVAPQAVVLDYQNNDLPQLSMIIPGTGSPAAAMGNYKLEDNQLVNVSGDAPDMTLAEANDGNALQAEWHHGWHHGGWHRGGWHRGWRHGWGFRACYWRFGTRICRW